MKLSVNDFRDYVENVLQNFHNTVEPHLTDTSW